MTIYVKADPDDAKQHIQRDGAPLTICALDLGLAAPEPEALLCSVCEASKTVENVAGAVDLASRPMTGFDP